MKNLILAVVILAVVQGIEIPGLECTAFDTTRVPDMDNLCMSITEMMDLDYEALASSALGDVLTETFDISATFDLVFSTFADIYNNNMDLLTLFFSFDIGGLITTMPSRYEESVSSVMTLGVTLILTPYKAAACGLMYDKVLACNNVGDRKTLVASCSKGFTKLLKETMDFST